MEKTCFLMNMAPLYVESAYRLFDKELDIHWCFGSNNSDIKEMDHKLLNDVEIFPTKHFRNAYYLKGALSLAFRNDIGNYVLLGEPAFLTTWVLPWIIKIMYPSRKVLFWTHGWYGKEGIIKALVKKLYFLPADHILTYGDRARDLMVCAGFKPSKITAIHNSLAHDMQVALRNQIKPSSIYKEHFGNSNPVLIFIGRLTPVKRLDLLVDAIDKLKKQGNEYNVVFIGDGSERENLRNNVSRLDLDNQFWFYGACYDEKTNAELVFNADLCVAPGNIGLTAMHVLVFGTPALTHNDFKWQMPEFEAIKSGETGCFFERGNVDSLVNSINEWFEKKSDKRNEVRLACYKEIDENWTPEFELNVLKQVLK